LIASDEEALHSQERKKERKKMREREREEGESASEGEREREKRGVSVKKLSKEKNASFCAPRILNAQFGGFRSGV
jgi:hypothetical protein